MESVRLQELEYSNCINVIFLAITTYILILFLNDHSKWVILQPTRKLFHLLWYFRWRRVVHITIGDILY